MTVAVIFWANFDVYFTKIIIIASRFKMCQLHANFSYRPIILNEILFCCLFYGVQRIYTTEIKTDAFLFVVLRKFVPNFYK